MFAKSCLQMIVAEAETVSFWYAQVKLKNRIQAIFANSILVSNGEHTRLNNMFFHLRTFTHTG